MHILLYIDATGGGMILQVLLSGFVGGAVVLKLFWRNMVNTVLRRKESDEKPEGDEEPVSDPAAERGRSR